VGAALSRARAIEETRQRNAELALINSVQEALAGELELQAIYDVVATRSASLRRAGSLHLDPRPDGTALSAPYLDRARRSASSTSRKNRAASAST
jgi:hypothetical protein